MKNTHYLSILSVTAATVLGTAPVASAQTSALSSGDKAVGAYLGLGAGFARYSLKKDDFGLTGASSRNLKENAAAIKLFAGYQLNEFVAVEGQIASLSDAKVKYSNGTVKLGEEKYKANALGVALVGIAPINQDFALFAKVGPSWTNAESKFSPLNLASTQKDRKVGLLAGVGSAYKLTKNAFVRGEVEHYGRIGSEKKAGRSNSTIGTISVGYQF
jgi:OmpA-OmpF porin, OOP family